MNKLFLWWTSNDDWDRVSVLRSGGVSLPPWPPYLPRVFAARGAPSNTEHILAHPALGEVNVEMIVGSPEHTISVGAVAIVIRAQDVAAVIALPGFVTDTQMNFVSAAPALEAEARTVEAAARDQADPDDRRVVPLRRPAAIDGAK